jgi:Ca2+-binding EF-hand superfamily protein
MYGRTVRPKLTDEQKQQLKECFELMDQDGSGAIDADELGAAFKLLGRKQGLHACCQAACRLCRCNIMRSCALTGIRMKRAELEQLLSEVDHDGSGEVRVQREAGPPATTTAAQ